MLKLSYDYKIHKGENYGQTKKVAWETPEVTEESVPTTPVPEPNDEGFNV